MYVTWQDELDAFTATRLQGLPVKVPPLSVKPTLPVGALSVPPPVSVTVAVQVDGLPAARVAGVQLTTVVVGRSAKPLHAVPAESTT